MPELWLFVIGGMFIAVVMVFPNGLAEIDLPAAYRRVMGIVDRLRRRPSPEVPLNLAPMALTERPSQR